MKQRLGIAAAMLSDPDLLLLDEPANGLDPGGMVAMREMLRYFTASGKTVVISSHLLHEVQQLADVVGHHRPRPSGARGTAGPAARRRAPMSACGSAADEVERAIGLLALLSARAPAQAAAPPDEGPRAGWLACSGSAGRARRRMMNRLLASAGVWAIRARSPASDLESGVPVR